MIADALNKITPHRRDFSFLHTFGATTDDVLGLPSDFSIYDGRLIPSQLQIDTRFDPPLNPLPMGCTGETATFDAGLQDQDLYDPQFTYVNTPPGDLQSGRDMRLALEAVKRGLLKNAQGKMGPKRKAYFNVYGTRKIDDCNAVRIALWVNQIEKRGVWVGSYWYWGISPPAFLPVPSFKINEATLHCWLVTGWKTIDGKVYLEGIPWLGKDVGDGGKTYMSREIFNASLAQPYTGAFTVTKFDSETPIPVGLVALTDHVVYVLTQFIRNLFAV